MSASKAIVVGGGVIGTAAAYYLARAGWRVEVVEQGRVGGGCSHANCGFVSPSHILPLAVPGAVRDALRSIGAKDSPLYIKPRFDPALWSWLWQFARRCNMADMLSAGRALDAMLRSSRRLYGELIEGERLDCEWEERGLAMVFRTPAAMEAYAGTDRLMTEEFQLPAVRFDGPAMVAREPALLPDVAGGWWYECDAHLRPDRLMAAWRGVLTRLGVSIHEGRAMVGLARRGRLAQGIETTQGAIEADAIVIAAGAWTPKLARQFECRVPIQPGKGYSITMPRPAVCPAMPLIFPEQKVAVTPMRSGYRLGSTMEFAGYDATISPRRIQVLRDGASLYLREPYCEPVAETWFGWRPMTYDSLPIVGRAPRIENVIIAAGHNMLGLSMAAATGKLVAEILSGATPHIDPAPYSPARFA